MCEHDYARILLECDKIHTYARAQGITSDEAFSDLVKEGTISRPPKDAIFDFTDAFLDADIEKAFKLLQECKDIGEVPLRMVTVLYSNVKRVLQVQVCEDKDICGCTGLTPYDVKLARKHLNRWQSEDLVFFLKRLQELELGVKTGEVESETLLDLMMVTLL